MAMPVSAQAEAPNKKNLETIEVEVARVLPFAGEGKKGHTSKVKLKYVSYSHDRSLFVGYYQDGWDEMVSLHDAKTKEQLGKVSCGGGIAKVYRFSKDKKTLGAKTGVGWYVWKIPSFEEVIVLGDTDFVKLPHSLKGKNEKGEKER